MPGLDGTGDLFEPLVRNLSDTIEVVVCEYPLNASLGYPELLSVAETYLPKGEPFVILGESFSGPIAIQIASKNPVGLKGMILVNTFLTNPRPLLGKIIRVLPNFALTHPPKILLELIAHKAETEVDVASSIQKVLEKITPDVVRARLGFIDDVNVTGEVPKIRVPIFILQAAGDWAVPKKALKPILNAHPNVKVQILKGNHFLLQEGPKKCAEVIESFCNNLKKDCDKEA